MTSIIFGIFFINLQILLFLRYYEFERHLEDINYFVNLYGGEIEKAFRTLLDEVKVNEKE